MEPNPATAAWTGGGGPAGSDGVDDEARKRSEVERMTQRRDNARWTAAVGLLMLFGAGFSAAFAIGGLLMAAYGVVASMVWSRRITKLRGDPWAYDPDLDGPRHDEP